MESKQVSRNPLERTVGWAAICPETPHTTIETWALASREGRGREDNTPGDIDTLTED